MAVNLTNVRIETDRSRLGQLLKAEIEDQANPDSDPVEKLYVLHIASPERDVALFINPDGTSSRGDLVYATSYTLTRVADGKLITQGNIQRISSYNSSVSADYASFVSQADARKRAVLELAQDYKLRLANVMTALNTTKPEDLLPDPNAPKPVDIIQSPNLDEINAKRY